MSGCDWVSNFVLSNVTSETLMTDMVYCAA